MSAFKSLVNNDELQLTSNLAVVLCLGDLGVVVLDHLLRKQHERCSSVGNGVNVCREMLGSNAVSLRDEFEKTGAGWGPLDGSVGDASSVFVRVDEAKVVTTWSALLKQRCENLVGKSVGNVLEERRHLLGAGLGISLVTLKLRPSSAISRQV